MAQRDASGRRINAAEAVVIIAFIAFCGVLVAFILNREQAPTLTIYSSLPESVLGGARNKQSADMERAIRVALKQRGGKVGRFKIEYVALDASNDAGEIDPETIAANARRAAGDSKTAVYIGEVASGASITSIPILSKAGVPQISPGSTRVGLTVRDPYGDRDEPGIYYRGTRNFVRVIPNDNVQAAAIVTLMRQDGCKRLATVYDGGDYSDGLTNNQKAFERPRRVFRQVVRPKAAAPIYEQLAGMAKQARADCVQYAGSNNPNTLDILREFAKEVPSARLYVTDGVSESSLTAEGDGTEECVDVSLMVPPRKIMRYDDFVGRFQRSYPDVEPDPYAIYAYEATELAIDAIRDSADGKRDQILDELKGTLDRPSLLGTYSIDANGDTSLVDYDVARIHDCRAEEPVRAVGTAQLKRALRVLRQRTAAPG